MNIKLISLLVIIAFICASPVQSLPRPVENLIKSLGSDYNKFCNDLEKHTTLGIRCISDTQVEERAKVLKTTAKPTTLDPVIFFPGLTGSSFETKFSKSSVPSAFCTKNRDWFRIWVDAAQMLTPACFLDTMMIFYDAATDSYSNTKGVEIRPLGFGDVSGFEYLAYLYGSPLSILDAYHDFVTTMKSAGYTPGVNFRGATYDWRLPTPKLYEQGFGDKVKALIEETYTANGNKPVHILAHSMGGPTSLYFLNSQTDAWKAKYIKSYIPIAAPWSGSPNGFRAILSGEDLSLPINGEQFRLLFRSMTRNSGGTIELLPNTNPEFWPTDKVFVKTPTREYTLADVQALFQDAGTPVTGSIYNKVGNFLNSLEPPNVPTHCIYGVDIPTEISYTYTTNNFDTPPVIEYSNYGDGVVPVESLRRCQDWASTQTASLDINEVTLDPGNHYKIIQDPAVLSYILSIISR